MSVALPGEYRWTRLTADDQSGILYIVTFLSFTYTSLTFLTRVLIKWRMLGLDDAAMLVAQVTSILQFALLLASLSAGLGKSFDVITDEQYSHMASNYSGAQVAMYITLGFSKVASILLVRRLFIRDMKNAWLICNVITGAIFIWTLVSAVLVSAGCSAESLSPRKGADICPGIEARYMWVVVTDAITDLVLVFVPTYLCRHLQMNVLFKLQVLGVFAARLPLIALAGLSLKHWKDALHSTNPGTARTTALVFEQCQLCLSLISATIPCLRSFIQSFDTGSGVKAGFGYSSNSGAYGHMSTVHHGSVQIRNDESYQMSSINRSKNCDSTLQREEGHGRTVTAKKRLPHVRHGPVLDGDDVEMERRSTQESDRRSEQSTQELFIRKDVQWEVKREPARGKSAAHQPGLLRLPK